MSTLWATARVIALRELGSYFRTLAGWIIIALFVFLTSVIFAITCLSPGAVASMRDVFGVSGWLLLPVAPAITMRLISEELRSGTIEPLLAAPVSAPSLVIGKFLGAVGFLVALLAPTLIHTGLLFAISAPRPDVGPIIAGYLCLALVGTMYLSIGLLASALTNNSTLAFMTAFFTLLALLFAGAGIRFVPGSFQPIFAVLAMGPRIADFSRGVIDTSHVVYFAGITGMCLLFSVCVMEWRRWR